jgi:non-ribosomal peptide synthetase component F
MMWIRADHPVDDNDVVLCRTAISFDAAGWEIWLPLLSGATLCFAPSHLIHDPGDCLRRIDIRGLDDAGLRACIAEAAPAAERALLSSCAFDPSIEQMTVPLAHGASIVIISDAVRDSPHQFSEHLARQKVDFLNCDLTCRLTSGVPSRTQSRPSTAHDYSSLLGGRSRIVPRVTL